VRKLSIRFHVINVVAIHVDGTIPGGASLHSDTIAEAAKVLQTMYGTSKSVATAVDVVVPVWEHAPHFLGSYSNIAVGTDGTDFVNMEKNMGGVWFAGEATDWDWNGYVTGAYFSGDRVAKCVAASKKAGRSVPCLQN
jgi:monoamine oxidase